MHSNECQKRICERIAPFLAIKNGFYKNFEKKVPSHYLHQRN